MHFKVQPTVHSFAKAPAPPNAQTTPKREKSQPKFNRKPDLKHSEKRKPDTACQMGARICYISPGKSTITSPFGISSMLSPTFEQIAHKFAVQDHSMFRSSANYQQQNSERSMGIVSNVLTELSEAVYDERDQQIELCHLEIQKLKEQIDQYRRVNKELKRKVKHFEGVQEFLVEREGFICELMRKAAEEAQRLQDSQTALKDIEIQVATLKKERDDAREAHLVAEREYSNKIETQKAEIEWILRLNLKLQEEAKSLKSPSSDNIFARRSKENAEGSRANPKRTNKSRSITFLQSFPSNLLKEQLNSDSWKELIPTNDTTETNCEAQQLLLQAEDEGLKVDEAEARKTVKKLRQKVKYYEIEIDILKRLKLDCAKVRQDNEKLKKQNRKLLHRVDYLTQNFNRRNNNSDSSLQLSLSPKKV